MFFTFLGLFAAMLFGVYFGSEGELPPEAQGRVFFAHIFAGATRNALQILYDKLCAHCHCRI